VGKGGGGHTKSIVVLKNVLFPFKENYCNTIYYRLLVIDSVKVA
jgi:hypothetical protein